jgi:hypothetical protein
MGGRLPRSTTVEVCPDSCALKGGNPKIAHLSPPHWRGRGQVVKAHRQKEQGSVINDSGVDVPKIFPMPVQ